MAACKYVAPGYSKKLHTVWILPIQFLITGTQQLKVIPNLGDESINT